MNVPCFREDQPASPDETPFLIAEIGINHNGDPVLAKEMIASAAEAGANCVKFQNYRTEDFVSDPDQQYSYLSAGEEVTESMFGMFKRYEIDRSFLEQMKATSDQYEVLFTSTPTSKDGIRDLIEIGAPLLKNGSDFLGNTPFVRELGESGLPTILSCGMSTLAEIDDAVHAFRGTGNDQLVLLHCTSSYPTPPEDAHLRKITTLRDAFGLPTGLSDHTEGTLAAAMATSFGACVIEKHFTTDHSLPGPDHRFSSDPEEFAQLSGAIREAGLLLGSPSIGPARSEEAGRKEYRLSCVAARDLPTGHVLVEDDIQFKRPGDGLPPNALQFLIGRTLARDLAGNTQLKFEHTL